MNVIWIFFMKLKLLQSYNDKYHITKKSTQNNSPFVKCHDFHFLFFFLILTSSYIVWSTFIITPVDFRSIFCTLDSFEKFNGKYKKVCLGNSKQDVRKMNWILEKFFSVSLRVEIYWFLFRFWKLFWKINCD